jgi:signal transduction histidine kinase
MTRPTDRPLRMLLKLEWLLMATAVFMELIEVLTSPPSGWSIAGKACTIGLFGYLGFKLPGNRLGEKLLYTAAGFGLILLGIFQTAFFQTKSVSQSIFLMCLLLVMRSCLLFRPAGQLVVLGLSISTYGTAILWKPIANGRFNITDWRVNNILLFTLTSVFAWLLINALLAERQSRSQLENTLQELAETYGQLRQYAVRIEDQATLQERNRIAREIHDGLGHTLAAQMIQINNALLFWQSDGERALSFLKQSKQLGSEAFVEIRKSVSMLRNPIHDQSLAMSLNKLLADFQQTTKIEVNAILGDTSALSMDVITALFRIIQESLTNISKHSQATKIHIKLQQSEMVSLSIEDNGQGFNATQNTTGFGLQGMRERAVALGGHLTIRSQPGQGCAISVILPLLQRRP